jgi:drug/metabolite transporter (DMT)-like permease
MFTSTSDLAPPRPWFGLVMGLITVFLGSIAPPLSKWGITSGVDPTTLLAVRMVIATTLLAGSIGVSTPNLLQIDRRGFGWAMLAGAINGVGLLTFFLALKRMDSAVAAMIFSLNPLATLMLLALRGEKFTYRQIIRLILGLMGVYLLIGAGGNVDLVGVLLVLVTVWGFAAQLVIIQWYLREYNGRTITLYTVGAIMAVSVISWLAQGGQLLIPSWQGWAAALILAVASTYIARLALFAGIRYLGGGEMALMVPVETFLSVSWAILFLGEQLTPWQWVGGAFILTSALLAAQRMQQVKTP